MARRRVSEKKVSLLAVFTLDQAEHVPEVLEVRPARLARAQAGGDSAKHVNPLLVLASKRVSQPFSSLNCSTLQLLLGVIFPLFTKQRCPSSGGMRKFSPPRLT